MVIALLAAWIGDADWLSFAGEQPEDVREGIAAVLGKRVLHSHGVGPLAALLKERSFDEVHLLSDRGGMKPFWAGFEKWLGVPSTIHQVQIDSPTNYRSIFLTCQAFLTDLTHGRDVDLSIHLSPGTPAMAATWVLLGKGQFPARFFQTFYNAETRRNEVIEENIPFELQLEFIPGLMRQRGRTLQSLAESKPAGVVTFDDIIGQSASLLAAKERAKKAALYEVTVLLTGESGTGKEMFARAIHNSSPRREKPFVPINCAAIPKELLESELFGYVKGGFTGASKNRKGRLKDADGGTLFLDEIGECPIEMQAKLLRALQPPHDASFTVREYSPVGSDKVEKADVRIIAGTNRNLQEEIQIGRFRQDVYYRLAAISIHLPSLSQRTGDIETLVGVLLGRINAQLGKADQGFTAKHIAREALDYLENCPWPGNIRQLDNILLQASLFCDTDTIQVADLQKDLVGYSQDSSEKVAGNIVIPEQFDLDAHLNEIQQQYIIRALRETGDNKSQAAHRLGFKSYQVLDNRLKRRQGNAK